MAMNFGKVAVLYGGESAEREVSLKSGVAVYEALCRQNIDAHLVDTRDKDAVLSLKKQNYDCAFIMLHGKKGEDGEIQGVLEWLGIPYTGSKITASAIAMNKILTKRVWQSEQLPVLPDLLLTKQTTIEYTDLVDQLEAKVFAVKPIHEGSSIGISKIHNQNELTRALAQIPNADVMIEPWIEGRELTVAIINDKALPIVEIVNATDQPFYDYQAKYLDNNMQYLCPAALGADLTAQIQALSVKASLTIGARAWGRVDLMLDDKNQPWLLEINLVPGMTDHSLVPMAAKSCKISFDELVLQVLKSTMNN